MEPDPAVQGEVPPLPLMLSLRNGLGFGMWQQGNVPGGI